MANQPERMDKSSGDDGTSDTDGFAKWEKIAPHIIGIFIVIAIIIGMKMSGHRPTHVAIAMKEGAGYGLVGYAIGWLITKLVFFVLRRSAKK